MASALEIIESSTKAEVETVDGIVEVTAVPLIRLFPKREDGTAILDHAFIPQMSPGNGAAVVAINDIEIKKLSSRHYDGGWRVERAVSVFVAVFGASDGTIVGAAERLVWNLSENVERRLNGFVPIGFSADTSAQPFDPQDQANIVIDGNQHGMMLWFDARYAIAK